MNKVCKISNDKIDELEEYYSEKIIKAFKNNNLCESDFNGTTGYGYNDYGRDKIENIYSEVLGSESALVRSQFISASHRTVFSHNRSIWHNHSHGSQP